MRMRKKKHGAERLESCAEFLAPPKEELSKDPRCAFSGMTGDIHLEIGCGKGRFAVESAAANPGICFFAVEKVENVLVNALELAESRRDECFPNLRFIRGRAEDLKEYFPEHSLSVIYLNFSDPWPKKGHLKRRLTAPERLADYRRLLKPGGIIRQKTDNAGLFEFSLEAYREAGFAVAAFSEDFHSSPMSEGNIMTEYEKHFSADGKPIFFIEVAVPDGGDTEETE